MSTIAKTLTGILFGDPALTLASAGWKDRVNAVYGFAPGGDGYTVFKPGSTFNSLVQLVPDGAYIVDARTPGFELPGAVLAPAGAGPMTVTLFTVRADGTLDLGVESSRAGDTLAASALFSIEGDGTQVLLKFGENVSNAWFGSLVPGHSYNATFVSAQGDIIRRQFTVPTI